MLRRWIIRSPVWSARLVAWNSSTLDATSQTEITEVSPSEVREKTYIQLIAPNTKAAKSWLYEGWPKTAVQGDGSSVRFPVITFDREQVGSIELGGDVFNVPVRRDILHQVVRWQRAQKQKGNHKTKTRAEVRGGGRKPWRQKGTGRARQGSIRAPHWRGGGKAHGPVPRSHAHKLNKKVRRLGLKCALSAKAAENRLMIVNSIDADTHKTKVFKERLAKLLEGAPSISALMLDVEAKVKVNKKVMLASRNVQGISLEPSNRINVYDLLRHDILVMTEAAVSEVSDFLRSRINR